MKIKNIVTSLALVMGVMAVPVVAANSVAMAVNPKTQIEGGVTAAGGTAADNGNSFKGSIKKIINALLFILGVLAVVMIIVGGLKYILSDGDSSKITGAKNTILYSVAGLVVAILAYAIVGFVLSVF